MPRREEHARRLATVPIWRTGDRPAVSLPAYMTPGSAGCDLCAALETALTLPPGDRALVPTGLAIALPEGLEGQVRPRSGLAVRSGLTVLNAPGTIDADYRGEIQVALVNLGQEDIRIEPGDRIAQLVVGPVVRVVWQEVSPQEAAAHETARGAGGFGHTGISDTRPQGGRDDGRDG